MRAHLNVPAKHQDPIHLVQGQLGCFRLLKFHKGKALQVNKVKRRLGGSGGTNRAGILLAKCNPDLVFSCHGIPTHCDASDRPKCDKGFLNLLLPRVIVDATHIYPRIHGHKYFPGKMQVLHLLITATACCL